MRRQFYLFSKRKAMKMDRDLILAESFLMTANLLDNVKFSFALNSRCIIHHDCQTWISRKAPYFSSDRWVGIWNWVSTEAENLYVSALPVSLVRKWLQRITYGLSQVGSLRCPGGLRSFVSVPGCLFSYINCIGYGFSMSHNWLFWDRVYAELSPRYEQPL